MYYFINEYILQKNSSVEHTAMNRVKLFNHYHQPAQIVTKIYDRLLHRTLTDFELTDSAVVNMYDFFQEATTVTPRVIHTTDLHLPVESEITVGANVSKVTDGDVLTSHVGFIPGTIGRVFYQEFLDVQGNAIETDLWDWRGFKSATQYFGQNGKLMMQRYYTPQGRIVMDEYLVPDTAGNPLTSRIILKDYQGKGDRFFQNADDLFAFFLEELARQDQGQTTFIGDRPGTAVKPLLGLTNAARKILYLPINHVRNPDDPLHAELDGFLQPAFDHYQQFDGFVTASAKQAEHLTARFPGIKVTAIPPVTTTPLAKTGAEAQPVAQPLRQPHSLLYVGRIAPDKQIDQLLRMFALVKDRVPDATFDLYGYGQPEYVQQMTDLVAELQLTGQVTFKDYDPQLAQKYDQYQVMANMSLADAEPLAMLEALAHGIPVVSYPFNYGVKELVTSDQNGYLIAPGNPLAMAEKIAGLFQDSEKLTKLSVAAYQEAHTTWTHRKVWNRWQRVLA
ncbi:poly(glycerol-phosphate) alpha-glucosyltransferase [Levilactobacillus zymae]|uniref:Poly(Glycerol-phosphate) alpha-glucosyltransferase n=1 Tax=Levilactobacillus zymae TaxID=267363 RepID=A0ABQ0WY84_9LACO|nr:accessory Sec system glycosyltransferase Asp1 [Levilactobacillus zymae]KRL16536.1 glycosyltransferase [Levilactobacillus zymae DSM 19395]QFR60948.1 accessory Sec system glycosyltransferase Asp1 [Levilactobacillus zymae]GEO72671.1 poly(glycerol-phosphate) alpha-glucosyltransferase [Levilactobacillus zymae]